MPGRRSPPIPDRLVAAMSNQGVDQSAGPVSGGWMHHQTLRLVDDNNVGVLVDHVERNGFGGRFGRRRFRHLNRDGGGRIDAMARITDRAPVDRHGAGFDQGFEPRAREFGDMSGKHAVEPPAGLLVIDADLFLRGRHCKDQVPKANGQHLGNQVSEITRRRSARRMGSGGRARRRCARQPGRTQHAAGLAARVRLMMLISGLTTLIAIAAVVGVIGYRIYHSGGSGAGPVAEGIVTLPKSARVIATAVAGDRIVRDARYRRRHRNPHLRCKDAERSRPHQVRYRAVTSGRRMLARVGQGGYFETASSLRLAV